MFLSFLRLTHSIQVVLIVETVVERGRLLKRFHNGNNLSSLTAVVERGHVNEWMLRCMICLFRQIKTNRLTIINLLRWNSYVNDDTDLHYISLKKWLPLPIVMRPWNISSVVISIASWNLEMLIGNLSFSSLKRMKKTSKSSDSTATCFFVVRKVDGFRDRWHHVYFVASVWVGFIAVTFVADIPRRFRSIACCAVSEVHVPHVLLQCHCVMVGFADDMSDLWCILRVEFYKKFVVI